MSETTLRNICILAHIDHGKTTLSDSLISYNHIISAKSAGKIRYLDSREDEQQRLITMKASAIALNWCHPVSMERHVVNLVDSPGHVDFACEVSAAVRLCDGALVLVDATEGVLPQTRAVIRQAWQERVRMLLVINKIDRLILDLRLTATEAYEHINNIIGQINAMIQQLLTEDVMADSYTVGNTQDSRSEEDGGDSLELVFDDAIEESIVFSPAKGNVLFASAIHGWCFDLSTFAKLLAPKIGVKPSALSKFQKALWGDYVYYAKSKKIMRKTQGKAGKPMCVQFILESIWKVYEATAINYDMDEIKKIVSSLNLPIESSAKGLKNDATRTVMSKWLPLAENILSRVVESLPSPRQAAVFRLPMLCPNLGLTSALACSVLDSSPHGPVVLYVTKFLAADLYRLVLTGDRLTGDERISEFIGLARVFSGTVIPGATLLRAKTGNLESSKGVYHHAPLPDEDDEETPPSVVVKVSRLFALMGRSLEAVPQASAGTIVGMSLEWQNDEQVTSRPPYTIISSVDRFLTLSSDESCPPFQHPYALTGGGSILSVSIEPLQIDEYDSLQRGLRFLQKADPSVEVKLHPSGEFILGCCGEVHLERCLSDLQQVYARTLLKISPPLIALRETLSPELTAEPPSCRLSSCPFPPWKEGSSGGGCSSAVNANTIEILTANKLMKIIIRADPLPETACLYLDENEKDLATVIHHGTPLKRFSGVVETTAAQKQPGQQLTVSQCFATIEKSCEAIFEESGLPRPNIIALSVNNGSRTILAYDESLKGLNNSNNAEEGTFVPMELNRVVSERSMRLARDNSISKQVLAAAVSGFCLASHAGAICEEPIVGVVFTLGQILCRRGQVQAAEHMAVGQVMSAVKEGCREAFMQRGRVRICEAMLRLDMQCEQGMLGKAYGVLAKRRARILAENLREGTSSFMITATMPIVEALGISEEIRSKSSGEAYVQIQFSHWERLEEDPFPEASITEIELEDFGEDGMLRNTSRKIITTVRKRKGLVTEEKIVVSAEKQRTLKRNK